MSTIEIEQMPDINFVLDHNPDDENPDRLWHRYPRDGRYRRSGAERPQIGDLALCGHVKELPADPGVNGPPPAGYTWCKHCVQLSGIAR